MNLSAKGAGNAKRKVEISILELWIYIIAAVFSLIAANIFIFSSFSSPIITILVDNSQTFSIFDEKLTFILNNDLNSQSKSIKVYAFDGPTSIDISSSEFVEDKSGETVSIDFGGSATTHVDNIGPSPQSFSIGINPVKAGLYHGTIFITNEGNQTSVPVTVDVKPQMQVLVIIVIDGIALSIAAWSAIKFLNDRYKITHKGQIIYDSAPQNPLSITQYLEVKKVTRDIVLKNFILNVGTIAFGIALGLTTLIDNVFITGIHNLGVYEIVILIAIGLGIGSLKEFVYKS
jgi:hypothetical protein